MDTSDAAPNSLQASWLTPRLAICRAVSGSWRRSAPARKAGCQPATVPELPVEDQRSAWMSEIWENLGKSMGIIWFIDVIGILYGFSMGNQIMTYHEWEI